VFNDGLAGTIALSGGELDLTDDVKINGPGADTLAVSGGNLSRVFQVEPGETVSISGLTIAGGNAGLGRGGGLANSGTLAGGDRVCSGNPALRGGGLANELGAPATVSDSTFTGDSALLFGGGISSTGALTVSDSSFTANSGGAIINVFGTMTVS